MSKGNVTTNEFVKFLANAEAMPSYGGVLYFHLHTADPGDGGTSSTNEVAYTGYARVAVNRDGSGLTVCNPTEPYAPNVSGTAFKNMSEVTFPECTGVSDDVTATHASICTATGQIFYSGALTYSIRITNLHTPRFPAGTAIFKED